MFASCRIRYVRLAVCICSIFLRPDFDVMKTTDDCVSAVIMMSFATQIHVCQIFSSIGASCVSILGILGLFTRFQYCHCCRVHGYYLVFHGEYISNAFFDMCRPKKGIYCQVLDDPKSNLNLQFLHMYPKTDCAFDVNCLICCRSQFPLLQMINGKFTLRF